jgi:hypothetical protein
MRCLMTVLALLMATALARVGVETALAQAGQAGEIRSTTRPKDTAKSPRTGSHRILTPRRVRDKARHQAVQTKIPDICTGC